jgi:hypothetical protein
MGCTQSREEAQAIEDFKIVFYASFEHIVDELIKIIENGSPINEERKNQMIEIYNATNGNKIGNELVDIKIRKLNELIKHNLIQI